MNPPCRRGGPRGRLGAAFALPATLCLFACGVQGPTRPPRVQQPERVTDLSGAQVGHSIRLSFTLPQLASDGERLTKPLEVVVLRATLPAGTSAPLSAANLTPWQSLLPADIEKRKQGDRFVLTAPLAADEVPGTTFRLGVRTLTRGFRRRPLESEISNVVELRVLDVPAAIQGLRAVTREKAIDLRWSAPEKMGSGYRVFRSSTGEDGPFTLRGETAEAAYSDPEFEFGRQYFYKVTAIVREGATVASSEDSLPLAITPIDTFPPAPPQELTAVFTTDAVELIWRASAEPDLAGYHVYRREGDAPAQRMDAEMPRTPVLRDTSVIAGKTYTYHVTALDFAGNESGAAEAVTVEVPAQ